MKRSGANYRKFVLMAIFCAVIAGGCNSLKTSGIDPTGEHVLNAPPAAAIPHIQILTRHPPPAPYLTIRLH